MLDIEKKKITAILLALLLVISSITIIINIDKIDGLFTKPETINQEKLPEEAEIPPMLQHQHVYHHAPKLFAEQCLSYL